MSSKQLVEYTVLDVSYNPQRGAEGAGKRRFQLEEVTVCRSDLIGEDDAIVVTNTHLARCCTRVTRCWATTCRRRCSTTTT